jgi:hypothetical protein
MTRYLELVDRAVGRALVDAEFRAKLLFDPVNVTGDSRADGACAHDLQALRPKSSDGSTSLPAAAAKPQTVHLHLVGARAPDSVVERRRARVNTVGTTPLALPSEEGRSSASRTTRLDDP